MPELVRQRPGHVGGRRGRDLLLLIRPGNPQVSGVRQVPAARTPAPRVMVRGLVRDLPHHRCPRAARLLPPLLLLRPLRGPPLLPGHLPPGQVIRRWRHGSSRCSATPHAPPPQAAPAGQQPAPPAPRSAASAPRSARLLPDQPITRIRGRLLRRHISHKPRSPRKLRSATTAIPHPPPRRNQR